MQNIQGVPICSPLQYRDCSRVYKKKYVMKRPPCDVGPCPVACDEVIYQTTNSYSVFAESYLESLANQYGYTVDYWKKNAVGVSVYYSQFIEQIVTHQAAYSMLTMLCDIGGALGLIIGASVISVLQLFDYFLLMLFR